MVCKCGSKKGERGRGGVGFRDAVVVCEIVTRTISRRAAMLYVGS